VIQSVETDAEMMEKLDHGIRAAVAALRAIGIETYESCEGGIGHADPEPVVRFRGDKAEAFKAYAAALDAQLPFYALRHVWRNDNGDLTGPFWEMVFTPDIPWWPT